MLEWIHGSPARARPFFDAPLDVWLDNGEVRQAQLMRHSAIHCYRLLDCTHPLQNVVLDGESIRAWRPHSAGFGAV